MSADCPAHPDKPSGYCPTCSYHEGMRYGALCVLTRIIGDRYHSITRRVPPRYEPDPNGLRIRKNELEFVWDEVRKLQAKSNARTRND